MTVKCVECEKEIEDGDIRVNYPTGVQCSSCGEKYDKKYLEGKKVVDVQLHFAKQAKIGKVVELTIGGYKVPKSLVTTYIDKLSFTRRAGLIAVGSEDPIIVLKALKAREVAHKAIFKHVGLTYREEVDDNIGEKSVEFGIALTKWVDSIVEGLI